MPGHFDLQGGQQGGLDLRKLLLQQLGFGGAGIGLGFLGNLLGGDGGQGERIGEAQGIGRQLFNTPSFNKGAISQQRDAFQQGTLSPFLQRLAQQVSSRVGSGSGIGGGFLLNKGAELSAGFEENAIQSELERALRQRLTGAGILSGLAR